MSYELSWIQYKRVILLKVVGKIDVKQSHEMNAALADYIEQGTEPVHLLVELGDDIAVPMDVSLLSKSPISSKKMGQVAMIGGNNVLRFMAKIVAQITHANAHMVDTKDEALEKFRAADPTVV